jgi:threonine dehydratase
MTSPAITAQSLTPAAIQAAYSLIQPHVHRTPLLTCKTLDTIASTPQSPEALVGTPFEGQTPARPQFRFFFKCENFQRIGAFKARGAFHALLRLLEERGEEVKRRGVITHSSGIFYCPRRNYTLLNSLQETMHKLSPSLPQLWASPLTS